MKTSQVRKNNFYPLLPPYMDSPFNHPSAVGTTKGVSVFVLKCIWLGTHFDEGYLLDTVSCRGLESTVRTFQRKREINVDGNFGQGTRQDFFRYFGVNLESVPNSVLRMPDMALQPNGEIIMWPPSDIILGIDSICRTTAGQYRLLPTYLDWPGAHSYPIGQTSGPSVFIVKCLFLGTKYFTGYQLNTTFCDGLAKTLAKFQTDNSTDPDSCFGQGTRARFFDCFGRNLEEVSRQVLTEADTALQPDGRVMSWPPRVYLP